MDSPRLIKKYANRRLYDTVESRHVTLADLRTMIVAGTDIKVVDETSGEDITRALLLQIIVDREQAGQPLLTEVLLAQLIRFHGNPMQGMMADYLQRSVGTFLEQQRSVQTTFRSALSTTPADTLRELVESNAAAWGSLMGLAGDGTEADREEAATNGTTSGRAASREKASAGSATKRSPVADLDPADAVERAPGRTATSGSRARGGRAKTSSADSAGTVTDTDVARKPRAKRAATEGSRRRRTTRSDGEGRS